MLALAVLLLIVLLELERLLAVRVLESLSAPSALSCWYKKLTLQPLFLRVRDDSKPGPNTDEASPDPKVEIAGAVSEKSAALVVEKEEEESSRKLLLLLLLVVAVGGSKSPRSRAAVGRCLNMGTEQMSSEKEI